MNDGVKKVEQDIARLLPDIEVRKHCLSVLLESLNEANLYGAQKWGVYCRNDIDRLRLLVGSLIVLTIQEGRLWMALDHELLEKSPEALDVLDHSGNWKWDTGRWSKYTRIPSINGFYKPSDDHLQIWPVIRQFHFAYIRKTANIFSQLREDSQKKHMPEVLEYLRSALKCYVTSPFYGDAANPIADPINDIQEYKSSREYRDAPETEREAIIQSRIGQGPFRLDLINYWSGCAVTGCKSIEVLRASHIKPWRESSHRERLDVYNGLLLIPNLDEAFDKGMIGFADDGRIIISSFLNHEDAVKLGTYADMSIDKLDKRHCDYLEYHRNQVLK